MITIEKENSNLTLKAHYNYGVRLRNIPGAHFDYDRKLWVAPSSSYEYILNNFQGELYFKNESLKREALLQNVEKTKLPVLKNITPFPYQETGAKFMIDRLVNHWFCLNADSVGSGKTLMSAMCIQDFINRGLNKIIIICKRSLKYQWKGELERFLNNPPTILITPELKKKRDDTYKEAENLKSFILITNYENYLNDSREIYNLNCTFAVIDEAHVIKSHTGKKHKMIAKLTQEIPTILLTGTPVMSKPQDLYGILDLGTREYLGKYDDFKDRYLVTDFGIYGEQVIGAKHLDELKSIVSNVMIRRTTDEIALELPEILPPIKMVSEIDSTQEKMLSYIDTLTSDMDERKKELLNGDVTDDAMNKIAELNEQGKVFIAAKQFIADDPRIIGRLKSDFFAFNVLKGMLPKTYKMSMKEEQTLDLVQEIVDSGEKVIVFCHFRTPAELLKEDIEKVNIEAVMFTGKESDKKREENLKRFKENVNVLIGTEAMAEGLNLQFCSYMIHFEQGDTYAQREQRIGRIRRPGAKSNVLHVYDMVTKDSFDEVKIKKINRDKHLSKALLD